MSDIEINISFTDKVKEILKEMAKPRRFEPGFVDAKRIISDGNTLLGYDSMDILGFAKNPQDTRIRRVEAAHAWFKRMYEQGWRFAGAFEYEGLLYNGFVIMERELPNKKLEELIESLTEEEKKSLPTTLEIDKGPDLGHLPMNDRGPFDFSKIPQLVKIENVGEDTDSKWSKKPEEKTVDIALGKVKIGDDIRGDSIRVATIPKEGFDSEVDEIIKQSQEGMKTLEQLYFDESGKNAIWHGKETKGFKEWKESRD